jgi:uncharacterized protein YjbI with pentapeptide repeats
VIERFKNWFNNSPLVTTVSAIGLFATNVAIFFALVNYLIEIPDRAKQRHFQAWEVINLAQKGTEGGRREAIRDLVQDGQPLDGTNLDQAYLVNGYFKGASLRNTSFKGANLTTADFNCTGGFGFSSITFMAYTIPIPWWVSCLHRTVIDHGDFSNALLNGANFSNAEIYSGTFVDTQTNLEGTIIFDNATIGFGTVGKNSPMRFEYAKLDGAKFTGALLPPAVGTRVNFSNATMNDVTFDETFFALYCCGSVIDLTDAVLTNVNVTIKGKNFPIDTVSLGNVVLCRTRVIATNGGTPLEVFDDKVVSRDCKK